MGRAGAGHHELRNEAGDERGSRRLRAVLHLPRRFAVTPAPGDHSGVFHPPTLATSASASFGPHVPGSYSYIGLGPWITGSTIAHAASTTSWRAKRVASPSIASPSRRSYASIRPPSPCAAWSTTLSSTGLPVIPSPGRFARAPTAISTCGLRRKR